ncbi:20919_t:CDS:2 [Gigaspora margarita]|uniref:20919_t:CDS:1 n=1 Tax=Gigaspora margarita TaxID=4874 RepID=A0ABN7VP03_GIGMA|nr:20919_t:CDS:2 [Gigaspora margarita]
MFEDVSNKQENPNIIRDFFHEFPLEFGWALKSKQKYGKKGTGKCISKKYARMFEEGELDEDEIPKLQTI